MPAKIKCPVPRHELADFDNWLKAVKVPKAALARRLGISSQHLWNIVNGRDAIAPDRLAVMRRTAESMIGESFRAAQRRAAWGRRGDETVRDYLTRRVEETNAPPFKPCHVCGVPTDRLADGRLLWHKGPDGAVCPGSLK